MAYDDDKALGYREAVTIVDIDLDINNPAIDFSNDSGSYNTPKTTIDSAAFLEGSIQTYIFSNQQLEYGVTSFPLLESFSSSPSVLKIGEDVALSASANVTFRTIESNDAFQLPPPYDDRRVIGGDFWGLMYARNEFDNREARLKRGYNPLSLDDDNFEIENYIIKSNTGVSRDGKTTISFIDRLYFASESKAKAPATTDAILKTTMSTGTASISFTGTNLGDKGKDREIVNGDVGMILIGEEIIAYTVTAYSSGSGTMSLTRGQGGSPAATSEINQSIQGCMITEDSGVFGQENITDFNRRLFNDFTDIGSGFIDNTDWDEQKTGNLSSFNFTNIITKPVDVRKLLKETIQNSGSWMYFDTITNKIVIGASARFDLPVITLTEDTNILQDSMTVTPQHNLQVTRASIRYNKLNFAEGEDDKNYANVFIKKDDIQEGNAKSAKQNEAKEIKSNWYTGSTTDILTANSVVQLKVERFSEVPNKFTFNLDAKDVGTLPNTERLWYGSVIEVFTRQLLNPDGTQRANIAQVISIKPMSQEDTYQVSAITYSANIPTNVDLFIDSDKEDYLLTDDLVTTEAREYVVVINSSVRITSSAVGVFAFDTGNLFAGATLKLINQGFIVGAGGNAGDGAYYNVPLVISISATNGTIGGNALTIRIDTTLDNLTGLIGSGGGGSGGSGAFTVGPGVGYAGGSGGSAGEIPGLGGVSANGDPLLDGEDGSFNFFGSGTFHGVRGADLGEDGLDGETGTGDDVTSPGDGRPAGTAITTNGNILTITGGDNPDQIKGAIT